MFLADAKCGLILTVLVAVGLVVVGFVYCDLVRLPGLLNVVVKNTDVVAGCVTPVFCRVNGSNCVSDASFAINGGDWPISPCCTSPEVLLLPSSMF